MVNRPRAQADLFPIAVCQDQDIPQHTHAARLTFRWGGSGPRGTGTGVRRACPGALPSGEFDQILYGACLSARGMILTICECRCEKLAGYLFDLRYGACSKEEAGASIGNTATSA